MTDAATVQTPGPIDDLEQLQSVLSARLVGLKVPGVSCGCGAIHCGEGEITAVQAPDEASATKSYLWTVRVTPGETGHSQWSTSLPLGKQEEREIFDAALARSAVIREAIGDSLQNWMMGREVDGFPDQHLASGQVVAVRCTQWQSYELAHIWEAEVQVTGGSQANWRVAISNRGVSQRQFEGLIEAIEERLNTVGVPLEPLDAQAVQEVFDAAAVGLAEERNTIADRLREGYVGQPHSGYAEHSPKWAPGQISDVVCLKPDFPQQPESWAAVVTPADETLATWQLPLEHLGPHLVLKSVISGEPLFPELA